jgi:hypothetical protein
MKCVLHLLYHILTEQLILIGNILFSLCAAFAYCSINLIFGPGAYQHAPLFWVALV